MLTGACCEGEDGGKDGGWQNTQAEEKKQGQENEAEHRLGTEAAEKGLIRRPGRQGHVRNKEQCKEKEITKQTLVQMYS